MKQADIDRAVARATGETVTLIKALGRRTAVCTLQIHVRYDPQVTDPEAVASAADVLLETALGTPGILDEYGRPKFGEFVVAVGPMVGDDDDLIERS